MPPAPRITENKRKFLLCSAVKNHSSYGGILSEFVGVIFDRLLSQDQRQAIGLTGNRGLFGRGRRLSIYKGNHRFEFNISQYVVIAPGTRGRPIIRPEYRCIKREKLWDDDTLQYVSKMFDEDD